METQLQNTRDGKPFLVCSSSRRTSMDRAGPNGNPLNTKNLFEGACVILGLQSGQKFAVIKLPVNRRRERSLSVLVARGCLVAGCRGRPRRCWGRGGRRGRRCLGRCWGRSGCRGRRCSRTCWGRSRCRGRRRWRRGHEHLDASPSFDRRSKLPATPRTRGGNFMRQLGGYPLAHW